MTKSELIKEVSRRGSLRQRDAELIVNIFFKSMMEALSRGERIELRGFGSFKVKSYAGHQGRNPKTGVIVNVSRKKLPIFKVGKELRDRVNKPA